ncbi:MAG: ribosomal protein S18-alanine N-acetyltransferase [Anaerolineales bacterium]|nr:ribosomal protein S18-alanine N-acetyltransferase [Anaerolineales bacterium]
MSVRIRKMTSADLPRVHEIDRLSMSSPWSQQMFATELDNPLARCWVAEADGDIVGTLVLWLIADEAHIATVAVHPDYRRQGIGQKLLSFSLKEVAAEGARLSLLEVRAGNTSALDLYRRFGYEAVGLRRAYYKDNAEDAILMTLHDIRRKNEH